MENLPIFAIENQIINTVASNQVTIIQADTGAGKSTQVPQMLYLAGGYNKVTVTQPRVMAAISLATRVAEELGEEVGETVGYKTRFYKTEKATPITYVTDGHLLSIFKNEPHCNEVIIIDEIHEFNLNEETLLGLYKKELENNPDLKIVVMSATVDAEKISIFFDKAPIVKVPGKAYPVEKIWEPAIRIENCVSKYFSSGTNMLVFLPGKEEINTVFTELSNQFNTSNGTKPKLFKLHGEMSYEEQKVVFSHYNEGKIILATNVAQTSITVPDIDIVVDTGNCKEMVSENGVSKLVTVYTSQADCDQRAGRTGRCKPGTYVLCSSYDFDHRAPFSTPEIKRISLENLVLKLATMNLDPMEIEFLHSPDRENLKLAKKLLEHLGALKNDSITRIGTEMEKMPVSARIARMLIEARKYSPKVQGDMAIIAAILECGDFRGKNFYVPVDASEECKKSDLTYQLLLVKTINEQWHSSSYEERKDFYKSRDIKFKIYQNILKVSKDIADKLNLQYMLYNETDNSDYQYIRNCIVSAYIDSIYVFTTSWRGVKYEGSDGITRSLDKNSVFSDSWRETPQFILAQPLDIYVKNGRYGPYTINLLKNATALDVDNEEVLNALLEMATCTYYYDRYENVLYNVFNLGSIEVKREVSSKTPTFENYTTRWGSTWRKIFVDGIFIDELPA